MIVAKRFLHSMGQGVATPCLLVAMLGCAANAWGQAEPHLGYLYPAGGQASSVFQILAGGQFLRGVTDAYVSGEGVHASVLKHYRPLKNLDADERRELQRRLREAWEKRWAELPGDKPAPALPGIGFAAKGAGKAKTGTKEKAADGDGVKLPEHPLLDNLENLSIRGLAGVAKEIMEVRKRQPNAQIGEMVLIEVTIDAGAAPGDRELRLKTPAGLSNPMCFQVGTLPEVREQEPNDPKVFIALPEEPPLDVPFLMNGQIMPGDVDRFRFRAQRGQKLVVAAQARHLIPYLADAVPGWFQATMSVCDSKGREVAFNDDNSFDPDPALCYEVPEDGVYELEIRDALYRGREDFVYRVSTTVGEQPLITAGGQTGVVPALETLPECKEKKHNDTVRKAQRVKLPVLVDGHINQAGDVDVFEFKGHAGDEVVAEVYARRLGSPVDSVLRLADRSGQVLAWNDDREDKESGLLTHHADSYLCAKLPEKGKYYVHVGDAQHQGGEPFAYRLRIARPQPEFALRLTPSSVNILAGRSAPVCVHAIRKDGFEGDIEIALKDAPAGFTVDGGRIPPGRDCIKMTLTAPQDSVDQPVVLHLEGRAQVGGETVSRVVVPAEDMMQAFAYRHLTPSQELLVAVRGARRAGPPVTLASSDPVRIPAGGAAEVRVLTPKNRRLQDVQFELSEPPKGVTLQEVALVPEGVALTVKADGDAPKPGYADNLIVQAFITPADESQGGKPAKQKQRISLGVLPAIPFEIVHP